MKQCVAAHNTHVTVCNSVYLYVTECYSMLQDATICTKVQGYSELLPYCNHIVAYSERLELTRQITYLVFKELGQAVLQVQAQQLCLPQHIVICCLHF